MAGLAARFGHEPGATLQSYYAISSWILGYPDQARTYMDTALTIARDLNHTLTFGYTFGHMTIVAHFLGDHALVGKLSDENLQRSVDNDVMIWEAFSYCFKASHLNAIGESERALASIDQGLPMLSAIDMFLFHPLLLSFKLDAMMALGQLDQSASLLTQIKQQIQTSKERWTGSDIHRIEGDLSLAQGNAEHAEKSYQQAIDIARRQSTKSFELRAATALARLKADQGEHKQAHRLLSPIYAWFTEGFDTPDLIKAKSLLDKLSS